jgi:hypothetical protein
MEDFESARKQLREAVNWFMDVSDCESDVHSEVSLALRAYRNREAQK